MTDAGPFQGNAFCAMLAADLGRSIEPLRVILEEDIATVLRAGWTKSTCRRRQNVFQAIGNPGPESVHRSPLPTLPNELLNVVVQSCSLEPADIICLALMSRALSTRLDYRPKDLFLASYAMFSKWSPIQRSHDSASKIRDALTP